jgi:integrase
MSDSDSISNSDPPRFLSQAEVAAFFTAIANPRDRALFGLIYHYGLRVSEATRLRMKDVDLAAGRIVIRRLKGGIWGIRPLFSSTRGLLRGYLATTRQSDPETPLFPGRRGPLRKRRIQQLFTQYAEAAGLPPKATCHSLRHAIATHLLDAGESLEFVKEHLGHQKIENTAIYARVSNPARDRAFARLEKSHAIVHPSPAASRPAVRHSKERSHANHAPPPAARPDDDPRVRRE